MAVLAVAVIVVLAARGSWGGTDGDPTWDRIKRERVLRVGLDASYPPFESLEPESGQIVGLDVDLAREITDRLGCSGVEFHNVGYDGLYDSLLSGRIDIVVSALPYDPLQSQDFSYSHSYFEAGARVVASRDAPVRGAAQLGGRRIAVVAGSEEEGALRAALRSSEAVVATFEDALQVGGALLRGDVDAAVMDGVSATQFALAHVEFGVANFLLTDEPYVVAMRVGCPILLREVNVAIDRLKESGWLVRLAERWMR